MSIQPPSPKPPPPSRLPVAKTVEKPVTEPPRPRRLLIRYGVMVEIALGFLLCGIVLGTIGGLVWRTPDASTTPPPTTFASPGPFGISLKPGPWGEMTYQPIYIEPPDEYVSIYTYNQLGRRWCFAGMTPDQLAALFQSAGLTAAQLKEVSDRSKWEQSGNFILMTPSRELILSLSPSARKHIYAPLTSGPNSASNLFRCAYPADKFDQYLADSGLPDETVALIRQLSYPRGNLIFFCDIPVVLDTLPTPALKLRLLKTVLRNSTMLLQLHVPAQGDLSELEHYWIRAGWGVDLRPMLESLTKLPGGANIDVVEMLPPLPSSQIYNFPFPSDKTEDQHKDCRWTSMNFFREVADPRFVDSAVVKQTIVTDYYPVYSEPRYGDLVALAKPNGDIIHLAIYIADNIAYTKNSGGYIDPYILMTIPDLVDYFSAQIPEDQSLEVLYFRNKYY